ncbi:protein tiptop-like [Diabrotica virgifera virgifera]|uniref:C2H2-type domain-containing protein n=1 Tax=Diabrotica virgifera virgifera TaxID=50390 RepID=A0ABM5IE04_DIAVI|nr:protein tiptop-like [Diabrotica virgifera virgifera]
MRSKSVPVNIFIRKINTFLGEGGEEGSPEEGEKLEGDDDLESMTPTSAASPAPNEDEVSSPPPGDILSPHSPRSPVEDTRICRNSPPRCNSHDSADSPSHPRSPPGESEMMSERAALLRGIPLGTSLSPVGVALPPTIPGAAAFLPPQSAAMAAYLNAAAAVAQQSHRLMMTSPLPPSFPRAPISPLISSSSSPPGAFNHSPVEQPMHSPTGDGILDFSKRSHNKSDTGDSDSDLNFGKPSSPVMGETGAPLDLSVSSRKRISEEVMTQPLPRKQRTEFKPTLPQWPPNLGASHLPYFAAAVAAAGLSPKNNSADLWNGKMKHVPSAPNDATKALEKMSELSKLGGEDLFRTIANAAPVNSASNRHSAWQSHWLNKGAEQAKDVLKCVWCKQSFPSLAAMTTHMKEAKHCGVNVPVPSMQSSNLIPQPPISSPSNTNTSSSSTNSTKPNQSDLNMLIKETMPLPRKLVRGQDVWLGKGAEQTRQILKCMWCGQSFRSLAEMTNHMQQTQHYTNIISQEQIISWRSTDDPKGGGGGGSSAGGPNPPPGATSSHVSAVLTCKVCDQAFTSLKELSNHMVKNSHYKEHIMRSITESGGRRRQTREKRKKSLPVRKLLELERAQHEFKNGDSGGILEKMRDSTGAGRITCEKCGNKIETSLFVDHIRQCVGGMTSNQRNFLKNALMSSSILPPESPNREKLKTPSDKSPSPQQRSPSVSDVSAKEAVTPESNNVSSPSVLNAIEKLIEKSFDSRSRQNTNFPGHGPSQAPMGSSILKRLGIDESVDYTKPLVDAQTMNLLRNYHHQQQNQMYGRRERSGSESSSMSERGSSRVDSLTPERKMEPPGIPMTSTPRSTPDIKRERSPFAEKLNSANDTDNEQVIVKKEVDEEDRTRSDNFPEVKVKREVNEAEEEDRSSFHSNGDISKEEDEKRRTPVTSPRQPSESGQPSSPCRNSTGSPASSERSGTPRSTNGDRKQPGGSLGALSSMFDSLSGSSSANDSGQTGNKRGSSHPLAALQKLCDKTETHTNNRSHSSATVVNPSGNTSSTTTASGTTPGAILAFSWACNDAVMTSDSIMKCAFCDTPFISKGAYRHHLSKMHFVKDGVIPDPVALKTSQPSGSSSAGVPLKSTTVLPPSVSSGSASTGAKSPPAPGGFEESPHSKFLKYTELAKQLSSKYV